MGARLTRVVAGALLTGCATVERGTMQSVHIEPDPADAACVVSQGPGSPIGPADGKVTVPRSRMMLKVSCKKPGYEPAEVVKGAMYSEKPFGGLSYLVDVSSGANYSYPPVIRIVLSPLR